MSSQDNIPSNSPPPPQEPPPSLPPPVPARQKKNGTISQDLSSFTPQISDASAAFIVNTDADLDDEEISQHMTQSYSEISFKSGLSPDSPPLLDMDSLDIGQTFHQRPVTLAYCEQSKSPLRHLNLEGTVHIEGNMTHFVAEDLEYKIKQSSPVAKKDTPGNSRSCSSPLYKQLLVSQVGQLDTALINDLEVEAHRMATSVDNLIENLSGILHSVSSITADNVDVYKNSVSKMSDSMDSNIKSMYTMMAKAEEVTQNMKQVEGYAVKIKEIKKLVDLFESFI